MTREEWVRRYKTRLIELTEVSEEYAQECADQTPFEDLHESWLDDPEGCAEVEVQDWLHDDQDEDPEEEEVYDSFETLGLSQDDFL